MILSSTIKYGIAAGIGTVLFLLSCYYIDKALIFNTGIYYTSLIFSVIAMWLVGSNIMNNYEAEFPAVLRQVFLTFLIADIIYYVWYYMMVNHIDVGLLEYQKNQMLAAYQALKAKTTDIEEAKQWTQMIQDLENNGLTAISISNVMLQMARGVIGGFLLAYIITFALNKRK